MSKDPAFLCYSNDFFVDTITWELDELGLYARLLFVEWSNGPLPNDHKKLAKIAGISPKKFTNLFQIVSQKFIENDEGNLINVRMEEVRSRRSKYSESRKDIANKRWEKRDAQAMHMHEHTDMHTGCFSFSSSKKDINTLVGKPEKLTDDCPHQEIIKIFHSELPMLTRIRDWTPARQQILRARWQSKKDYQDLDWWKQFFAYIREKCPFLVGQSTNGNGKRAWQADLPWILQQKNFTKIVEGGYEQ